MSVIEKAIEHYGARRQIIKAMEEMAELMQLLAKHLDTPNKSALEHITEEIADVEIMINQLKTIYKVSTYDMQKTKLERLRKRLSSG